jgi:MFS family permease
MSFPSYFKSRTAEATAFPQFFAIFAPGSRVRPLLLSTFCFFLGEAIFSTVFNLHLADKLEFSFAWLSSVYSISMVAGALISLPLGYICDHIGRRFVLKTGFYFWLFGLVGMSLFSSAPILFAFSILHGVGMAAVWTAFAPEITELTPPEQHVGAFSANFVMMFSGSVAGYIAGGLLPDIVPFLFGNSVGAYRITMVIGAFCLFPAYRLLSSLPEEHYAQSRYKLTHASKSERSRRRITTIEVLLPYLFSGIAVGLSAPFINVFLRSSFSLPDHSIGFSLAAVSGVQALLIALIPMVSSLLGRVGLSSVSLLIAAPVLAAVAWLASPTLSVVVIVIGVGLVHVSLPLQISFAMRQYPSLMRGFISSEMAAVWYFSLALGAFLSVTFSGNQLELVGMSYLPAAFFSLAGGALYWLFWRKRNRTKETAPAQGEHLLYSHGPSGRFVQLDRRDAGNGSNGEGCRASCCER